ALAADRLPPQHVKKPSKSTTTAASKRRLAAPASDQTGTAPQVTGGGLRLMTRHSPAVLICREPRRYRSSLGRSASVVAWPRARLEGSIDGDDLRRIGHRILPEARGVGGEEHVPGRTCPGQIARQRHTDHRGNPAPIQVISLHDHHGSSEARSRARGFGQIRPPALALRHFYHSLRSRIRRAAAVTNGSVGSFSWSMTWFMASVTSSGACRERYSESASA